MRALKTAFAILTGLLLFSFIFQRDLATAVASKAVGGDEPCPWAALARYPWAIQRFLEMQADAARPLRVDQEDAALGIERIVGGDRPFWIKKQGGERDGKSTLAYILAEQQWISHYSPAYQVKPGDVVVDVGAHIGTFDDSALRRGASKCILVEPDPVNVECIRRNFAREIADGRVVVVPEGAWNGHATLEFNQGVANSGTGSFVVAEQGARKITVPVRPLDEILRDLGIPRITYMKMDIEGAERQALQGAAATLRNSKPVLMLDHYHLPDDPVVLPRVIGAGNPEYRSACDLCSPDRLGSQRRFVPYAVFYH